jgi:hypothetical protein
VCCQGTTEQERLRNRWGLALLALLLLIHVFLHLKYVDDPPSGFHLWRQAQTLAVARNFHEEGMNILEPRIDARGAGLGISGMEFPLLNYTIALAYQVWGFHHFLPRLVMLGFGILALLGAFLAGRELFRTNLLGIAMAFFLLFSPLFHYYSFVCMPDVPMLSFLILGIFFIASWYRRHHEWRAFLAISCLVLAALIKISALIAVPAVAYLLLVDPPGRTKGNRWIRLVTLVVGVGIVAGWYLYARHLNEIDAADS